MSDTNSQTMNGAAHAVPKAPAQFPAQAPGQAPAQAPARQAGQALPLFFRSVVGINPTAHAHLRLDRSTGYGFAAGAQAIPVGIGELEVVSQHYPIVFTTGAAPTPVALMGLKEGANLFVQPNGAWRQDSYVPAYVRSFPFIFVEDPAKATMFVAMDESAPMLRADSGAAIFEDGKPSPALTEAINFCAAFRDSLNAGVAFARAMDEAGLLEEEEATVNFTAGGVARVRGFKILKADRIDRLSDETYVDWRRRGWISAIYAHLFSTGRWARLVEMSVPPTA